MTRAERALLERLARRVSMWHAKHEETGDDRYAYLAAEADRMYRHAREVFGPCMEPEPWPSGTTCGLSA